MEPEVDITGGGSGAIENLSKSSNYASNYSGGGGGSTDIRINGSNIENRILVAAGGGGAWASSYVSDINSGGHTGNGGTNIKSNGSLYQGKNGYSANGASDGSGQYRRNTTGGGGGGYYGGETYVYSDGAWAASYAGTCYADENYFANISYLEGSRAGNGYLKITLKEMK